MTADKTGHPLPASEEAGTSGLPKHLIKEKGVGDDARAAAQPAAESVAPDGAAYDAAHETADHPDPKGA